MINFGYFYINPREISQGEGPPLLPSTFLLFVKFPSLRGEINYREIIYREINYREMNYCEMNYRKINYCKNFYREMNYREKTGFYSYMHYYPRQMTNFISKVHFYLISFK